jgi:hypothetical protein
MEYGKYNSPIVQSIGDFLLIMAASEEICYLQFPESLSEDNIVEGTLLKD